MKRTKIEWWRENHTTTSRFIRQQLTAFQSEIYPYLLR